MIGRIGEPFSQENTRMVMIVFRRNGCKRLPIQTLGGRVRREDTGPELDSGCRETIEVIPMQ